MQLKLFKTLWGFNATLTQAVHEALEAGFQGIEGPAPDDTEARRQFRSLLDNSSLDYIAEITTAGEYVPRRHATPAEHLHSLQQKLEHSINLNPLFITCLAGCDAWPEETSVDFFRQAIDLADRYRLNICFETHRSRSFFNPWTTRRIVSEIPDIKLTADFSHWCVVCERLMDTEMDTLEFLLPHIHHVHARVGYEQGPQVPHPAAPEYAYALRAHQQWWRMIWDSHRQRAFSLTTMTPEFGPDGYLHEAPFTREPVANLWELNKWIAQEERRDFSAWHEN